MKSKTWAMALLALTLAALVAFGALTAFIDPFFHYHAPLPQLQYPIDDQRYQNDGIVRHFPYDAIITGTSLTENFKASQFDALFGVNSVKVCFSGGTYHELNQNLRRAFEANPNIQTVLFGIDSWFLFEEPGAMRTDAAYPMYLYDDSFLNDVEYLLNKQVLCSRTIGVLEHTVRGGVTTDFDTYSCWGNSGYGKTGRDIAIQNSPRHDLVATSLPFTEAEQQRLTESLTANAIALAQAHPDTQFLYFFPPYSILYWDYLVQAGEFDKQLAAWRQATDLLLTQENIQLYSFMTDYDTITNLDNYRDNVHYGQDINALLLDRMAQGQYRLTEENAKDHWDTVENHYRSYDYDAVYEG